MLGIIALLLALWIACIVIGFTIKALLWLAVLGLICFVATAIFGAVHRFRRPPPAM